MTSPGGSARELYQSIILEHARSPRNYRRMGDATGSAEGTNPLCGDEVTVFIRVEDDVLRDVSFQGMGCAISRASASLMTQAVKGRPIADARRLFEGFHALMTQAPQEGSGAELATLGKLAVLGGVRTFPMRVKCATLAWHTLSAALKGSQGVEE